jgi:hypothetical protein
LLQQWETLRTQSQTAYESIRYAVDRLLTTPDEALFTSDISVAGWKLRLRSTSFDTLALYSRRLHSRSPSAPDSATQLTFTLLETGVLGWPPMDPSWRGPEGALQRIIRGLGLEGTCHDGIEPCTIFDPIRQIGAEVVTGVGDLPPWHTGAPFRVLFHLAALSRGWQLVHAATLAVEDQGVLLVGPGKAGKSGTTLAGISTGLKTVGDDYVLICPGPPPTALRVYNLLKQDRAGLARFRGLANETAHLQTNWQAKLELDPEELFQGCLVERLYIRAILAPKITNAPKTKFLPVDPQPVFRQFWPSQWQQLPVAQAAGFKFAASLTRSLPTFAMLLSDDPSEIGNSIRNFIAELTT